MDMDMNFNSIEELFSRLGPALNSKRKELEYEKLGYIKKEDIWNYLIETKWKNAKDLTLADMVDDIFNCNNNNIDKYLKDKLKERDRTVYFNNIDDLL
jgi:hypothetical protein